MDSSFSSSSSIDDEHSKIMLFDREQFLSTYLRYQTWSLPDSIIYYISKNPSNSKIYEKMIQSCKYFFIKNPILIVSDFSVKYKNNQWNTYLNGNKIDLNRVSSKLWITDEIIIENDTPIIPSNSLLSTILSKIYQSDIKDLAIQYQKIFINDFILLAASKCEDIIFDKSVVIDEDGSVVGMEKIVEVLPKIKEFHYYFSHNFVGGASQNVITPKTVQKLIQIPNFTNLEYCCMQEIPEIFDIDTLYDYIKKNKRTRFYLKFGNQLSQEYRHRLQTIINEIIAAQHHDYKVPFIQFSGNDISSSKTMYKLFKGL